MPAVSEDEVNRLRIALARISRMVDRQVDSEAMTRTQRSVLGTLARRRTLGMSELAEIEGLNPTMLSRIVGQLESAGLLRRRPGHEDRRAVIVEITATGNRLHTKMRRHRTRLLADRLAELSERESGALVDAIPALESLAEALRPAERIGAGA